MVIAGKAFQENENRSFEGISYEACARLIVLVKKT